MAQSLLLALHGIPRSSLQLHFGPLCRSLHSSQLYSFPTTNGKSKGSEADPTTTKEVKATKGGTSKPKVSVSAPPEPLPKRIPAASQFFLKDHVPILRKKSPGLGSALLKTAMADWKALPAATQKKYQDKAAKVKAAILKARESAKKPLPNAYSLFLKENFVQVKASHPDFALPAVSKLIAEMWKSMPQDQKDIKITEFQKLKAKQAAA